MNLQSTSPYSPRYFAIFRIIFGIYLTWHFATLIPYATELFAPSGILADQSPYRGNWPNPFFHSETAPLIMTSLGVIAALLITIGRFRKTAALYLWFLITCQFTANPLIINPSLAYTGLLLILLTLIPTGEALTLKKTKNPTWKMPAMIPLTAWILMAIGYTFSGIEKLTSPSWLDGTAMQHVLENPLARPGIARDVLLNFPTILIALTFITLALEILFAPLALIKKTRPYIWLTLLLMHLGIILVIDFTDLSLGMIMIHLFTFQRSWLPAKPSTTTQPHIVFLDGQCSFCQTSAKILQTIDSHQVLNFTPLQGQTANKMLPPEWRTTTDSNINATGAVALIENPNSKTEKRYRGPDAALRTLHLTGGPLAIMWHLHHIPKCIKNPTYNFIAKHRHQIPLIPKSCPIPTPESKKRHLP